MSDDGTTVESLVYAYRDRQRGTEWVSEMTFNLELADIPLKWSLGNEALQLEVTFEGHGEEEVQSHVARIAYHEETFRNGEPESLHDYVSTDWSGDISLYLTFSKSK